MQLPLIGKVSKQNTPWMLGLISAGVVGVTATMFAVARQTAPQQNITNMTVPAEVKDVTVRITASGEVVPVKRLNLNPKAAGRLAELRVEQGDRVREGQIIARMDSQQLEAQRDQAKADLAKVQANLAMLRSGNRPEAVGQAQAGVEQGQATVAAAQTRLDLASQRVQRNRSLAAEGAISKDRLDEVINEERSARANLEQAKATLNNNQQQLRQQQNGYRPQEIQQAEAQVQSSQANLRAIETQLEDTIIRAPFDGVVTQRNSTVGDFVTPTSFSSSTSAATSIVTLANDLEILAKVPEVDIGQIKPGQEVEIRVDAYPKQTFKGVVRLVSPEAKEDPTQKGVITFEVRVRMLTGKNELRSGMTTDLAFLGNKLDQALLVPSVAIVTSNGQSGVLIPDQNNKPRFKPVKLGSTIGTQTQVLEGVQPGEPVFVELPEGQKVEDITKGVNRKN